MLPLISVIMPCRNQAQYIPHALDSMLAQTYPHLEIIVINDHSTDGLGAAVQPYIDAHDHIRYVHLEQDDLDRHVTFNASKKSANGGWAARNYGISLARGDFITFQDADDGSCANRIAVQYALLKKYDALHVNVDWQQFREDLIGVDYAVDFDTAPVTETDEILALTKKTARGIGAYPFVRAELSNPVSHFLHKVDRKFFRDWSSYPGAASMPLLARDVFERCEFRDLFHRTRPSFRGIGADRDFNFWVAETFRRSVVVHTPLILWRTNTQNPLLTVTQ